MLNVQIQISGAVEKIEALSNLEKSFLLFQEAFSNIGENLVPYFEGQVFASQGGILGESWDPLSENYAKWKAVHYPGRPPLVREGSMQSSFYYKADDTSLEIGNTSDHFIYHQSSEPRDKIPRRVMLAINDDVKTIIAHLIDADINKKINEAGL